MKKSRHFQERMSQRGFNSELQEIVLRFAVSAGDKLVLNRKAAKLLLAELDDLRRRLVKMVDKGGAVFVEEDGTLITGYRAS